MKRVLTALLSFLILLPLSACWSYRGLNELTIVAGAAIDFDAETGNYHVTCEIIDLTASGKEAGTKAKLVESDGRTPFDAVRNAKKKLISKLYWGNTQILILGKGLAEYGDLGSLINWFISDAECREIVGVIVSKEKTAKDILTIYGLDNSVVSYELKKIVDDDQSITGSLCSVPLYQAYNVLRSPGVSMTLPAFRCVKNDEETVVEADGQAVFKGQKLIGFLSPEETEAYLFAINKIHGGILTFSNTNSNIDDITVELSGNKSNCSFSYENGVVTVKIETDTEVFLDHAQSGADLLDEATVYGIEEKVQAELKKRITNVIRTVQTEYNSDIFGFGNMIYKENPKLWEQIGPQWDTQFRNIRVDVQCRVHILNSVFLKHD